MDRVLSAIADRTRREILAYLKGEPHTAGDLAARFGISWPAISRHLRLLREAGLVTVERSGRLRRYHLNPEVLRAALADMLALTGESVRPLSGRPVIPGSSLSGREAIS